VAAGPRPAQSRLQKGGEYRGFGGRGEAASRMRGDLPRPGRQIHNPFPAPAGGHRDGPLGKGFRGHQRNGLRKEPHLLRAHNRRRAQGRSPGAQGMGHHHLPHERPGELAIFSPAGAGESVSRKDRPPVPGPF